ncbi:MAG: molybdopterin-binding protein, partial [Bacteroidaceae bacterium]|nr:molybdopterin-binding protein [Bacteroidaceae bacterium]
MHNYFLNGFKLTTKMDIEIINIGDELLIGQVVNTNASFMSEELNKVGLNVNRVTTIADDANE